jgi:opacity protein-like surface antigen
MNRQLMKNLLRGIALPSPRRSRLFTPVLLAALALVGFWAVPALADDVKVEPIPMYGGQIKYTFWLIGDRVIYRDRLYTNPDGSKDRSSFEYDENGFKKTESEIKYDKNGNIVSYKITEYSYYPDGRLKEIKLSSLPSDDSYSDKYEYDDGNVTITRYKAGQAESPRRAKAQDVQPSKNLNPFGEEYKKVKAAAEEAKRRGAYLGPSAAPSTPALPGAPAVPAQYAATAPRWLKGAYVAANLGVGFTSAASFTPSFGENFNVTREQDDVVQHLGVTSAGNMSFPGNVNPSLIGGVKIGRYGCCFSDNPIWDYFGWCFDISYQRYSLSQQSGTFQRTTWVNGDLFSQGAGTGALQGDGSIFTLAFLVNARYGFLPTTEIPFGALQPYVGVGPALVVNRFDPKIMFTGFNGAPVTGALDFNGETSVNAGLAVEAGMRYYPFQHVFLDLSYRYLYTRPDFSFTSNTAGMKLGTTINNSAVRFGVGYAF